MQKLRGSGTTFSTSGKRWAPFRYSPHLAAKKARLHRLVRKGLTGGESKTELRALAERLTADRQP